MEPIQQEQDDSQYAVPLLQVLMRLAWVEILKNAAGQEAQGEHESFLKAWTESFRQSLNAGPCSQTGLRAQSAG